MSSSSVPDGRIRLEVNEAFDDGDSGKLASGPFPERHEANIRVHLLVRLGTSGNHGEPRATLLWLDGSGLTVER